ncbi:MAG: hypothetical protein Tsb0013_11530 [Phycisphaerales bacterium]
MHRLLPIALTLAIAPAGLAQTTWFVDDDAPNDPGPNNPNSSDPNEDGSDTNPFDRLNEAIDASASGDTIVVRPGTYIDTQQINTDGKAITITSSGGPSVTFLDGFASPGSMILMNSAEGRDTVIENLTLQGGFDTNGGALEIDGNVSAIFRNIVFRNNTASVDGGAVFFNGGTGTVNEEPLFVDCLFENNVSQSTQTTGFDGGAGFFVNGAPTFLRCTFRNNNGAQGGALALGTCHRIDIIDCLFENNHAIVDGGGLKIENSADVRIVGTTFLRNTSVGGGGLDLDGSATRIDRCRFLGNSITNTGGIGGAVLTDNSTGTNTMTVTNTVFVGNTTNNDGGAIALRDTTVLFENCTVTANVAGDAIGGIFTTSTARTTLLNSIVTGNTDAVNSTPDYGGTNTTAAYTASYSILDVSNLPGGTFGANLLTASPLDLFVRVPDPGMDALWGTSDDDYGDLRLLPTAIAIDSGSSDDYTGPLADLDANDRAQDDPNTPDSGLAFMSPTIDMGAFEFNIQTVGGNACAGDFDLDGDVDLGDFGAFGIDFGRNDCND